ncbi:hypothetical protein [Streptomyces sp. NBC_00207]|uniref:hypothetical protein n=1 Tax=Streptomyces sp. NBC_00207 TaxID=2903635 RepID=UPI00325421AC
MTTPGAGSTHPLVEHLHGIWAGERAKRATAQEALTEVQRELADVQRRFHDAEQSFLAADVRLSAVSDTIRQAEEFLGVDPPSCLQADSGERPNAPGPESSDSRADESGEPQQAAAQPGADAAAKPRSLEKLIIEALTDGLETPVSAIVSHAQLNRPGTTPRQITNCASRLQGKGKILIIGRGLYRLANKEPRR